MSKILLVGGGGREHALAWKLAQSPLLDRLLIAPGSPGTAEIGHNVPVSVDSHALLLDIARREHVGLVVIGIAGVNSRRTSACMPTKATMVSLLKRDQSRTRAGLWKVGATMGMGT